jgi:hypothetical protein
MRVQVLADGFQTFGEDYEIGEPSREITVKLKRPQKQFSIYEDQRGTPKKDPPSEQRSGTAQKPQ